MLRGFLTDNIFFNVFLFGLSRKVSMFEPCDCIVLKITPIIDCKICTSSFSIKVREIISLGKRYYFVNWSVLVLSFLSHVDKYVLCSVIFSLFYLTFTCIHVLTFFYVTKGFMDWIVRLNLATQATEDRLKMNVTVIRISGLHWLDMNVRSKKSFVCKSFFYIKTNIIDYKIWFKK